MYLITLGQKSATIFNGIFLNKVFDAVSVKDASVKLAENKKDIIFTCEFYENPIFIGRFWFIFLKRLNSKALKPLYSGYISNTPLTIKLSIGLYFITTYRSGGYKISSLSVLNIQIDNGSFLETLVKGEDYDATVKMDCTENGLSANYKIKLSGNCAIKIYKVCQ